MIDGDQLTWRTVPPPFEGQQVWGAIDGRTSYVIVLDHRTGDYTLSAKLGGPQTTRHDLGRFRSLEAAQRAAEESRP